jgi:DNA modification methylase
MIKEILCSDNIEILRGYPDNYFDSVVTDAPYGLGKEPDAAKMLQAWITEGYLKQNGKGFMGKSWDAFVPQPLFWKEVFRVLKPGGHVLSFFGTRTYDWGTMAMRLAGFEIRDSIMWVYGSGFPKSMDVSKAIDKKLGAEREVIGFGRKGRNLTRNGIKGDMLIDNFQQEAISPIITTPNTEGAKKWQGYGTALKPAHEPIVLARKPLDGTVAENVLKHGVGGLNLDGCRIGSHELTQEEWTRKGNTRSTKNTYGAHKPSDMPLPSGRFPANFILDETTALMLDAQAPKTGASAKVRSGHKGESKGIYGDYDSKGDDGKTYYNDGLVGASRFFYIAKASQSERNAGLEDFESRAIAKNTGNNHSVAPLGRETEYKNHHPTVKPIKLMQYLVRLITPPNGICLDPFAGSGTTLCACELEGLQYVGIDMESDYVDISKGRVNYWSKKY